MPTVPASAAAAAPAGTGSVLNDGEVILPSTGASAGMPDPNLILGFQIFEWLPGPNTPKALGRIQVQYPAMIGDHIQTVEMKTGKVDATQLVAAFKALRTARPDLAKQPLQDFPRGRKGHYTIKTYGTYSRTVGDDGDGSSVFTD